MLATPAAKHFDRAGWIFNTAHQRFTQHSGFPRSLGRCEAAKLRPLPANSGS
jgi:hypothetical protein